MSCKKVTRKDFVSLGISAFGTLLLYGCSTSSSNASTNQTSDSYDMSDSSISKKQDQADLVEDNSVNFSMLAVRNYSDDVAWVSRTANAWNDRSGWNYLVDLDGKVLISPENAKTSFFVPSDFCNDVACVNLESANKDSNVKNYGLINKRGEIIWSLEDDGLSYAVAKYGESAVTGISADVGFSNDSGYRGYLAVEIDIDTYSSTGSLHGVLDSKGEWVIEPGPLDSASKFDDKWFYCQYVMCNTENLIIYRTGEVLDYSSSGYSTDNRSAYARDFGGRQAKVIDLWEEYTTAHDGLRYDTEDDYGEGIAAFRDASRNVVMDVNDLYPNINTTYSDLVFNDGYCLIVLENTGGGKYITVINTEGAQITEPFKYAEHGALLEGAFFYNGNDNEPGYFMTAQGEKLGQVEAMKGMDFHDGRAWVLVDDEWHCIDSRGEIVF